MKEYHFFPHTDGKPQRWSFNTSNAYWDTGRKKYLTKKMKIFNLNINTVLNDENNVLNV